MSKGYLLQVFNKTNSPFKLPATLHSDDQWESASKANPKALTGIAIQPHSHTGKFHGEVADNEATFTLNFTSDAAGTLSVNADAGSAADGGEKDCVEVIADFFKTNGPGETILLCIQSERGTTDYVHDAVLDVLDKCLATRFSADYPNHLFTGEVPGTLGTLRGKIVLLRRYWIDPQHNNNNKEGKPCARTPGS
jgi:hypothetical protein